MRDSGAKRLSDTPPTQKTSDLTGRDQMTRNVLASWAGHLVFIVIGFVLPRLVDRRIGQESLGVWDLGWSLISYFGLVSGGVMSSISRYVARYRAAGDRDMLNTTVGTGLAIYLFTGGIVLVLTILATALVHVLFGERLAGHYTEARWVVLLLGLSLVAQFVFAVFNGIITGCHRWGVHNAIAAGARLAAAVAMIVALLVGGGLRAMAVVIVAEEVSAGLVRVRFSYRFVPGLRVSPRQCTRQHAMELVRFGGKTLLESVSRIILYQTSHLLILGYMGPAALAVYARAAALVRHTLNLLNKFAYVFTPTASALQSAGEPDDTDRQQGNQALIDLLIRGTRYGLYISLPMVLVLSLLGGPILRVWMGERYAQGVLLAVLAVGHLPTLSQRATYQILVGMGRHGLPALAMLVAGLVALPLAIAALGPLQWGLLGAALALVIPLSIANAVVLPLYACRILGLSWWRYWGLVTVGPVLAATPLAVCLLAARSVWSGNAIAALAGGVIAGGLVSAPIYWRWVIPNRVRNTVMRRLGFGRRLTENTCETEPHG